jgi:lipopolysaccharide transport system permease protein
MKNTIFNILYISSKIAYSEIKVKYRRSILGPLWISVNMLITIFALAIIFSSLFKLEIKNYIPYVFSGLLAWNYINTIVQDSIYLYINGAIKNFNFPVFFFPFKNTLKNTIISSHNIIIYIIILITINHDILNLNILYILIALPIYFLNSVFISLSIGLISLRYRDIGQIILNLMYLIFLVTPIFWDPNILEGKKILLAQYNPLYSMIEIIREPLLGKIPSLKNYIYCILTTIVNGVLAYIIFKKNFNNKVFWL